MADIAVENKDAPVVEKEVEETETPKVAEEEEENANRSSTENGTADTEEAIENGVSAEDKGDDDDDDEEEESANGDSADAPAPAEAVKRKQAGGDAPEGTPAEDAATPEKKAKLDDSVSKDVEANGAEAEVVA